MSKTVNILLSEHGLPDIKNGSWTQRIKYFLESTHNVFDYVICGPTASKQKINTVETIYCKVINNRFVLKLFPNIKYHHFMKPLNDLISKHDNVLICVMDNIRLNNELSAFLEQNNLESKVNIIFYNCGFSYFLENREHINFCKHIDEIIFLTKSAYNYNKEKYSEFVPKASILNNPVDKNQFAIISKAAKAKLLEEHKLQDKTVFLWLSHNRPKKGLKIILNAWSIWSKNRTDVELLVVGVDANETLEKVRFLGRIPSNEVHVFYKLADVYLFPTLWKEGFGLSLAQAISSGCYCIAAENGGVKDYMSVNDGQLIENPNFINDWVSAMETAYLAINNGWENKNAGSQILSIEQWSQKYSEILVNCKTTN